MLLPPGSNGLFHSAASYLSSCLDVSFTAARRLCTLPPSATLENALSLIWQPLNVALSGGVDPIDHAADTPGMSIVAYDYFPNLDRHTLSIEWEILGCGEYKLPAYHSPDALTASAPCGPFNLAADVYINSASNKVFSYDPNNLPVDPIHGPLLIRELTSFRTEHELHPPNDSIDSYAFHVFGFAINPSTNLSIDIARFAIANTFDGFTISSRGTNVTKDFTYNAGNGLTTVEILAHALEVGISPSKFTQGLTMCMLVTNWVLTIVSTYYAFSAVRKGRVDFAIVILHASTGLAVSAIQKLYASPPPFGEPIDTWGSFSQIAILVFCSMMLVYTATKSYLSTKGPSRSREKV